MIVTERPESFFASSHPHQRRHVPRTRPFRPTHLRPRNATLPEQTKTQRLPLPAFAAGAVLRALNSLRPKISRTRPAWALPAPPTQAKHERTDPHEDEDSETEAEVEALLSFAEELDVEGLEEDMEVVAPSSSSPPPSLPSPPATPRPQARISPSMEILHCNPNLDKVAFGSQPTPPCSPGLQALPLVAPAPAISWPAGPTRTSGGTIHSARSVAALIERRALAVIVLAEDKRWHEVKEREQPLLLDHRSSPVVRRRREGGKGEAAAEQHQKEEAASFGRTAGGQEGGGRPLEMPRLVVIDEEGGLRRQRRLTQLSYWHENPAL